MGVETGADTVPAVDMDAKMLRQEARSQAQGGRWLDPSEVAKEPEEGYGTHTKHHSQASTPEVKEALERAHDPEWRAANEKEREARAVAQGGRWMDASNMPRGLPRQNQQEEVKEAAARAHSPEFQEEQAKAAQARHHASGGRW